MGSGSSTRVADGKYSWKTTSDEIVREFGKNASGKTAIVTGANSGIGFETARALAKCGAEVILACRNEDLAKDAISRIQKENPKAKVLYMNCDLSSMESVWNFCTEFKKTGKLLHFLINNAGAPITKHSLTLDGLESQFAVNHIGHFILSMELIDVLVFSSSAAMPGRIINVSCFTNYLLAPAEGIAIQDISGSINYDKIERHGSSKLANILFTRELARRVHEKRMPILVVSLHPGIITGTKSMKKLKSLSMMPALMRRRGAFSAVMSEPRKTIAQGAATTLFCALSDTVQPSLHYSDCKEDSEYLHPAAKNENKLRELWKLSVQITGVREFM